VGAGGSGVNTIAIVDYGMGNLHSVARALRVAAPDADVRICSRASDVLAASRIVFPGQGAMPDCMRTLQASGLQDAVLHAARSKPLLGICVGEQMLFSRSEEGDTRCLGIFPGRVRRFEGGLGIGDTPGLKIPRLKVPHMGWNRVRQTRPHALWHGMQDGAWFYFVHSYFVQPDDSALVAGSSDYGVRFTCAVARDNIFAVQFHPEKSSDAGLQLLRNFAHWQP